MKAPSCMGICIHSNGFCEDTSGIGLMVNGHGKVDRLMVQGFHSMRMFLLYVFLGTDPLGD